MANWCLNATSSVKFAVNAGWQSGIDISDDVCQAPDDDRHDDHCACYGAAMAAVRVGASDCLAIHNVVSTSRGRASDRHPSNSHDYHDRLSVILLTGLT